MRTLLALVTAAVVVARPANDWSKPCFHGECAYDLPASSSASGTLKISGPSTAIADITEAGGWIVLSCDPNELVQDIRLVCKSVDEKAAGCDHLFQGAGPVNKLLRLPEHCGSGPFVRIAARTDDKDQHIPQSVHSLISRRDGQLPKVHVLSVDVNFDAVDPSVHGPISFALVGTNVPGIDSDMDISPAALQSRDSDLKIPGVLKKIGNAVSKIGKLDVNKEVKLPEVNINKDFTLVDQHLSCGPVQGSLKVDVHGEAHATASVGVVASGQLVPPKIDKFGAFATLSAELGGNVHLAASLTGDIDSGVKTLFQQGIPGFSIPGIFTLGPSVRLDGQAKAHLDLDVDVTVGLNFKIDKAQLYFPASAGKSGGNFQIQKTPLKLSASPSVSAKGSLEGHIIPRLVLGLSAFANKVKADVNLALDASAELNLEASVSKRDLMTLDAPTSKEIVRRTLPPYGSRTRALAAREPDATFSGCVDIDIGINAYAEAEGSFLNIFNKGARVNIFKKQWQVYKKCFGNQKRSIPALLGRSTLEMSGTQLSCPGKNIGTPVSVAEESVDPGSMKSE